METLENMYTKLMGDYENVQAARGCNQHKHVSGCPEAGGLNSTAKEKPVTSMPTARRLADEEVTIVEYFSGEPNVNKKLDLEEAYTLVDDGDFVVRGDKLVWKGTTGEYVFKNSALADYYGMPESSAPKSTKPTSTNNPKTEKSTSTKDTLQRTLDTLKTKGSRALYDKELLKELKSMSGDRKSVV